MKYFVLVVLVGVASAGGIKRAAPSNHETVAILRSEADVKSDGYNYVYETANGIYGEASGALKKFGPESEAISSQGQFKYTSPEGETFSVTYIADENGYQPQGSHLPVAPPIPDAILRSLQYIEAHPAPVEKKF